MAVPLRVRQVTPFLLASMPPVSVVPLLPPQPTIMRPVLGTAFLVVKMKVLLDGVRRAAPVSSSTVTAVVS